MIHLDTSALIGALAGQRTGLPVLRRWIADQTRVGVCTIVLYEWWRGSRTADELSYQELLLPTRTAVPFGAHEAQIAAEIYRRLQRPRPRAADIAIAACAIAHDAALWTLNPRDFDDIPGLQIAGRV